MYVDDGSRIIRPNNNNNNNDSDNNHDDHIIVINRPNSDNHVA